MEKQNKTPKDKKWALFFGVTALAVGIAVFMVLILTRSSAPSADPDKGSNSFFPFIPIWIAVFVPLLVSNKKKEKISKKNKILLFSLLLITGILVGITFVMVIFKEKKSNENKPPKENIPAEINDFKDCLAAGNPVMESWPRQCRAGERSFVEDIGNEMQKRDQIRLDSPRPNQELHSPLSLSGEAVGTWYFEATFPVKLVDKNGNVIAQKYATATEEWMTEAFVPFKGELSFSVSEPVEADLILVRDNPSGLPEYDDELRVPVMLMP